MCTAERHANLCMVVFGWILSRFDVKVDEVVSKAGGFHPIYNRSNIRRSPEVVLYIDGWD